MSLIFPAWPRAVCSLALAALTHGAQAGDHAPADPPAEPSVQRTVLEDDHVRIEELRVRGQLQQATVQPKMPGAKPYQIVTGKAGRDPSNGRGAAGQRVWNVFGF